MSAFLIMELVVDQNGAPVSVTGFIKSVSLNKERSLYKREIHSRIEMEFVFSMSELPVPATDDYTWFLEIGDTFIHVAPGWIVSTSMNIHEFSSFTIVFPVKSVHKTYEELCAAVMREKIEESI